MSKDVGQPQGDGDVPVAEGATNLGAAELSDAWVSKTTEMSAAAETLSGGGGDPVRPPITDDRARGGFLQPIVFAAPPDKEVNFGAGRVAEADESVSGFDIAETMRQLQAGEDPSDVLGSIGLSITEYRFAAAEYAKCFANQADYSRAVAEDPRDLGPGLPDFVTDAMYRKGSEYRSLTLDCNGIADAINRVRTGELDSYQFDGSEYRTVYLGPQAAAEMANTRDIQDEPVGKGGTSPQPGHPVGGRWLKEEPLSGTSPAVDAGSSAADQLTGTPGNADSGAVRDAVAAWEFTQSVDAARNDVDAVLGPGTFDSLADLYRNNMAYLSSARTELDWKVWHGSWMNPADELSKLAGALSKLEAVRTTLREAKRPERKDARVPEAPQAPSKRSFGAALEVLRDEHRNAKERTSGLSEAPPLRNAPTRSEAPTLEDAQTYLVKTFTNPGGRKERRPAPAAAGLAWAAEKLQKGTRPGEDTVGDEWLRKGFVGVEHFLRRRWQHEGGKNPRPTGWLLRKLWADPDGTDFFI